MREKIFEKFKIKDIVFLAIISAVALCTCAVMPLVASLQTTVFGIAQAVTGLQLSIFFAIGLMKVRKMGSLFIKEDRAIFFAVLLYNPLSLPFNLLYNYLFGREAMVAVATRLPWLTVVMTLLVIAISALGAWIGIRISRELKKSGAMKR